LQMMTQPPADLGKAPAPSRERYGLKGTPDKGAFAGQRGHKSIKAAHAVAHK